jgi:hypothetical protein
VHLQRAEVPLHLVLEDLPALANHEALDGDHRAHARDERDEGDDGAVVVGVGADVEDGDAAKIVDTIANVVDLITSALGGLNDFGGMGALLLGGGLITAANLLIQFRPSAKAAA